MKAPAALLCAVPFLLASSATAQVWINEIRIDQIGTDVDEFFELAGALGTSLAGLTYVVLGDTSAAPIGSGVVEEALSLTGSTIPASGLFVAAEATFTLGAADLVTAVNFENSDNVTHLLVSGFTGAIGMDLDTNDDGVLDVTPWTAVLDRVAVIREANPPTTTEYAYGPPFVGPEGAFSPGGVYRSPGGAAGLTGWNIGDFSSPALTDTPGAPNGSGRVHAGTGGPQTLVVDVGPANAGNLYLIATNFTGTAPGTLVGPVLVPLNFDALVVLSISLANTPIFVNTFGTLDADGRAFAALNVPVLAPALVGTTFNSAALIIDYFSGAPTSATNPVPLVVVP